MAWDDLELTVGWANLEFGILLPRFLSNWDYKPATPGLTSAFV